MQSTSFLFWLSAADIGGNHDSISSIVKTGYKARYKAKSVILSESQIGENPVRKALVIKFFNNLILQSVLVWCIDSLNQSKVFRWACDQLSSELGRELATYSHAPKAPGVLGLDQIC